MAKAHYLSESEAAVFRAMSNWFLKQPRNQLTADFEQGNAPVPTYVAKVPTAGIPPLAEATGTGGDVPGSAECSIYKIHEDGTLVDMGITRIIYNISTDWIEKTYTLVERLGSGKWVTEGDDAPADYGTGTNTGTGTDDNCHLSIAGVTLSTLPVDSSPQYALGIDSSGCLVLIPIGSC